MAPFSPLGPVGRGRTERAPADPPEPDPDEVLPDGPRVTVMTRNLSFGTELKPILEAESQTAFLNAVATAFNQAMATDFPIRARAWADEIEETRPDLIGLQEAVLWRFRSPADPTPHLPQATDVAADLVELLLGHLQSRGLDYVVVIAQEGQDIEAPGVFPTGSPWFGPGPVDIRLTHREVILARRSDALALTNEQGGQYVAQATVPIGMGSISLPWAWASVDATMQGRTFRFATTHLDPASAARQKEQAREFLIGPGDTQLPIVWVGDFNSDAEATSITGLPPSTDTYGYIIEHGFRDTWKARNPGQPGFTCCQWFELNNPVSRLEERVDLVFTRERFPVIDARLVGNDPASQTPSGLWPSDHAGVVVTLGL
jgi:endonuclease/exonuclease/phosphatase family metal-dependent hydrolase